MKTYTVKNYKGNLVESLKRFSDSHKGMKIIEACEDKDELKIKAEESENVNEEKIDKKTEKVFKEAITDIVEKRFNVAEKEWEISMPFGFDSDIAEGVAEDIVKLIISKYVLTPGEWYK